jgi:heme-degrading monooxygenase HmoA
MIARVWSARATRENVARYEAHFRAHVLPELKRIDGYVGASVLTLGTDEIEIIVSSRWRSLEAVRGFAGDDLERAVVNDEAKGMLLSWDERVQHYEVRVDDSP